MFNAPAFERLDVTRSCAAGADRIREQFAHAVRSCSALLKRYLGIDSSFYWLMPDTRLGSERIPAGFSAPAYARDDQADDNSKQYHGGADHEPVTRGAVFQPFVFLLQGL